MANVFLAIFSAATLFPLEAYVAYILYRHWDTFGRLNNSCFSLSTFIRMASFLLLGCLGAGLAFTTIPTLISPSSSTVYWGVLLPTASVIGAITFGTRLDIMKAWLFWHDRQSHLDSTSRNQAFPCSLPGFSLPPLQRQAVIPV